METSSQPKPNEGRIKHLELLQAVISKMSNNSFVIKGWCITLVVGLLALSAKDSNHTLVFVAYLPLVMMWGMDAYYLRQERLYRRLYDECRAQLDASADFSMNTAAVEKQTPAWARVMFSRTLLLFYGTMAVALLLTTTILRGWHLVVKNWF